MTQQTVALIGAGNLTTCAWVLGSLASYYPDWPYHVRLYDAHPEQLGLATKLFEVLLKDRLSVPEVSHTADLDEALLGATDVVVTMGAHTARRIASPMGHTHLEVFEVKPDPFEMRRGDPNRPTPQARLSHTTRDMVARPQVEFTDSEAVTLALQEVHRRIGMGSRVAAINTPVDWADNLSFETGGPTDDLTLAYQILRWITDDEPAWDCTDMAVQAPLLGWLKR